MRRFFTAIASLTLIAVAASASETITYNYDAKGRVILIQRTGTVNNNVRAEYDYDKVDSRTNTKVTGSP